MTALVNSDGTFNRREITAKAMRDWRKAVEQGADGETATLAFWQRYVWRVARGKREMQAPQTLEHAARAMMAQFHSS